MTQQDQSNKVTKQDKASAMKVLHVVFNVLWIAMFVCIAVVLIAFNVGGGIPEDTGLFTGCLVAVLFGIACVLHRAFHPNHRPPKNVWLKLACVLVPIAAIPVCAYVCFFLLEYPSNYEGLFDIASPFIECEQSVIFGMVLGSWLIFQRRPIGYLVPMLASLAYGIAEHFIEVFKNSVILPSDLRSFATGLRVAGDYTYELTDPILLCVLVFTIACGIACVMPDPLKNALALKEQVVSQEESEAKGDQEGSTGGTSQKSWLPLAGRVAIGVLSVILGVVVITYPIRTNLDVNWKSEGLAFDYWFMYDSFHEFGIIPSFMYAFQLENPDPPEGYASTKAEEMQEALAAVYDEFVGESEQRILAVKQFDTTKPNIVMVMNESFVDLSFLGEMGAGYEGPEFFWSEDALARGNASVSVYGGGTCNSEFEGLSGLSLGYLGNGFYPYVVHDLSDVDMFPAELAAEGYETTAIHPENPMNWGRSSVYPAIGFDTFLSYEDFPAEDTEMIRDHISDASTYEKVVSLIVDNDEPQFVFDLTMQGHGGYDTGLFSEDELTDYPFYNVVDEEISANTNEYVTSIAISDAALHDFLAELSQIDEPTVVVFYGDHQPWLSWRYKSLSGAIADIDYQESMYVTDYMIWANYDVAGEAAQEDVYEGTMAAASLLPYTLNMIGAPLDDFRKAEFASRFWLQSNNVYGFMDSGSVWHDVSEANEAQGSEVFTETLQICQQAIENGLPEAGSEASVEESPVIFNAMRWISYLNYFELL